MIKFIKTLESKIKKGYIITYNEALKLSTIENEKDLDQLMNSAYKINLFFNGKKVDLCSIINGKCGKCLEDCKFCAQSAHYKTNILEHELVSYEKVLKEARENQLEGCNRFSLVTSGRGLAGDDFFKILEIYKNLNKDTNISLCASLGILNICNLIDLKNSGVLLYHHNLETSENFYPKICTTHSYEERIKTIKLAQKAGLKVCSGGIIGLGETFKDRLDLAFLLNKLNVHSIPINILNPIKGTPLENSKPLCEEEILKTISIFRFINPKAYIRLAGGRNLIKDYGKKCFLAGANATITGNYLTTSGNKIKDDIKMIKSLNLEVKKND